MSKPPVVILAAGASSRMFPLDKHEHKGLVRLCGKTLLEHTLDNLVAHDFNQVVIVTRAGSSNHIHQILSNYFSNNLSIEIVEQNEPKGMGDALLTARQHLAGDFAVIAPYHHRAGALLSQMISMSQTNVLLVSSTPTPWQYGIVELDGDRATNLVEKPPQGSEPSNLKVQVLYLLGQQFLEILSGLPADTYNFETALNQLMKETVVKTLKTDDALPSLKYAWNLFNFQHVFLSQLKSSIDPSAQIASKAVLDETHGPIVIEAGAKVGDFTKLVGPTYLGPNTQVGDHCLIRQSCLEAGSRVGAHTEIARSILLQKASIHFGYLADSILGSGVSIGAGLLTANKRLDRQAISTLVKEKFLSTRLKRLGVIIGDQTKVGIGVHTMPGVLIGADTMVMPHQVVARNIDHA